MPLHRSFQIDELDGWGITALR